MIANQLSVRSIPGGGKTSVCSRSNSAWICALARRTVAVDATILGRTRRAPTMRVARRSIAVSYKPGHRAERAADQVQLVLDDQIGRIEHLVVEQRLPQPGRAAP